MGSLLTKRQPGLWSRLFFISKSYVSSGGLRGMGHDSLDLSFMSVVLLYPECKFKKWLATFSFNGKTLAI